MEALRQVFMIKIKSELQVYESRLMKQDKEQILDGCIKLTIMRTVYESLVKIIGRLSEMTLRYLISKDAVLEVFYNGLLQEDDYFAQAVIDYLEDYFSQIGWIRDE